MNTVFIENIELNIEYNSSYTCDVKSLFNMNDIELYVLQNFPDSVFTENSVSISVLDDAHYGVVDINNYLITYSTCEDVEYTNDILLLKLTYDGVMLQTFKINIFCIAYNNIFHKEINIKTIEGVERKVLFPNSNGEFKHMYRISDVNKYFTSYNTPYYHANIHIDSTNDLTELIIKSNTSFNDTIVIHAYRTTNDTFDIKAVTKYEYEIITVHIDVIDNFDFGKELYDNYTTRMQYRESNKFLRQAYGLLKNTLYRYSIDGTTINKRVLDFKEIYDIINKSSRVCRFNQQNKLLMNYTQQLQ